MFFDSRGSEDNEIRVNRISRKCYLKKGEPKKGQIVPIRLKFSDTKAGEEILKWRFVVIGFDCNFVAVFISIASFAKITKMKEIVLKISCKILTSYSEMIKLKVHVKFYISLKFLKF